MYVCMNECMCVCMCALKTIWLHTPLPPRSHLHMPHHKDVEQLNVAPYMEGVGLCTWERDRGQNWWGCNERGRWGGVMREGWGHKGGVGS